VWENRKYARLSTDRKRPANAVDRRSVCSDNCWFISADGMLQDWLHKGECTVTAEFRWGSCSRHG